MTTPRKEILERRSDALLVLKFFDKCMRNIADQAIVTGYCLGAKDESEGCKAIQNDYDETYDRCTENSKQLIKHVEEMYKSPKPGL